MTTLNKVKQVIADYMCVPVDDIEDNASLKNDIGMDSLDILDCSMKIYEVFGIVTYVDDWKGIETIGDVVVLVEGK